MNETMLYFSVAPLGGNSVALEPHTGAGPWLTVWRGPAILWVQ